MKQRAILVDIDGTIANHMGHDAERSHYDYDKVDQDLPFQDMIDLIEIIVWGHEEDHRDMATGVAQKYKLLFLTGRVGTQECVDKTTSWLKANLKFPGYELFMRNPEDHRADTIIKEEIYKNYIEPHYDVKYVFEDRSRVVKMWRGLGLRCLQVAEGEF